MSVSRTTLSRVKPLPEAPIQMAEELARDFAATAVERDRRGGTAKRERDFLRASGLLGLVAGAARREERPLLAQLAHAHAA